MTYDSTILATIPAPTLYYVLNELSGTVAHDSTSNHNDGVLSGVSAYNQTGPIIGDSTPAIAFTSTGKIALPSTVNVGRWNVLTLEYWIKQTGLWQYLAITASPAGVSLYLNGDPYYGGGSGDPIFYDTPLDVTGTWQSASIGRYALYNAVLSPQQIANHFATGQGVANQVAVLVAGAPILFDEDTWQLHLTADERQRCQFTVLDYPGTARYTPRQQIVVTDPTLGRLFSGVVIDDKQDASTTNPDVSLLHQIDTSDNMYFIDKRTSNRLYTTPQYASSIVFDAVADTLAAEGIVAPYARRIDTTTTDWSSGSLTNTVATGNVGDGDLELLNTGSMVSVAYLAQADWSSGAFSSTQANTGGDLSLIGITRNWNDGVTTGQTLFGGGGGSGSVSSGVYNLSCNAANEMRSRLDFAGNWNSAIYEVDVSIQGSVPITGITYSQTGWVNGDNAYAYCVELKSGKIDLRRGSNGGGTSGSNSTSIGSHTFSPQLSNGTYRIRVVKSGSSHSVYLNGVLYISATDGTYGSGQISVRNRNAQTSGTVTQPFDNFGVMAATTGTWTGVSTSINSVSTIATSVIAWDTSLSQGGAILVQTSIDGGVTWQTCTSGGFIPLLGPGTSGTGKSVLVRVTLSTTTTATMPDIRNLNWSVTGGYTASGTRVSTPLSLTPVGRIGSTVVSWNVNLPSVATTLGVDTSIDGGVTWTDVTNNNGGPVPGLNTQPDPTTDGFNADSSANYTSFVGYGGGFATWTYDLAHSRLTATNGESAVYLNNTITIANVDLFVDMDTSDAGGLVFCYIDAQNYYGMIVADNQASIGTKNRMVLYKTVGAVQSTLATGTVAFQRGTYHRIRAQITDGVIVASFDGVQILSYTDSSPLGAGQVGLYQTGGTQATFAIRTFGSTLDTGTPGGTATMARFYLFWIQPLGDNGAGQTITTRCRLATTDPTVTPQVLDLTVAAYSPSVGIGALIPSADYRMQFVSKLLDDVAKQSNYICYVDQYKVLNFRHRSAIPAPWILQSNSLGLGSDLEIDSNLVVDVANDLFRNRQNLIGVLDTGAFVNNFQGDGQTTSFTLQYPVAPGTVPTITLNTIPQTVGKKGTTGSAYYYADNDPVIAQDSSLPVLVSTDRLASSYTGIFTTNVTVNNLASQAALAPPEGGTGIVEAVEDVSKRNMMYNAAIVYANQLLTRYCLPGRTITFTTYRNGLAIGQILNVFVPEEGLFDVQMLILSIDVTARTQPGSTILYQYVCTASELPNPGSWAKLLASSILLT